MATDAFTNSNGTQLTTHSGSWNLGNALASDFVIDTNALRTPFNRNVVLFDYYSGTFPANQLAQGKLTQIGSALQHMGVCVRASAGQGYTLEADGSNWYLWKVTSYSPTAISSGARTQSANDVILLRIIGTSLFASIGGATVYTGTDATIATGAPGVAGRGEAASGTYTLLDDWSGVAISAKRRATRQFLRAA